MVSEFGVPSIRSACGVPLQVVSSHCMTLKARATPPNASTASVMVAINIMVRLISDPSLGVRLAMRSRQTIRRLSVSLSSASWRSRNNSVGLTCRYIATSLLSVALPYAGLAFIALAHYGALGSATSGETPIRGHMLGMGGNTHREGAPAWQCRLAGERE